MVQTWPLGASGEITHWLLLGYLSLPRAAEAQARNFDRDLLADLGGEAQLRPVGGRQVTVGGQAYTWQLAPMRAPSMMKYGSVLPWLALFHDQAGAPVEHTAAYVYTRLVCPQPLRARLLFGTDDAAKLFVNGACVYRFPGGRPSVQDDEELPLDLVAGENTLIFRIENYALYGGLHARLVDAQDQPLRDVTIALDVGPRTPVLSARDAVPWSKLVRAIPPVPPAPGADRFGAQLGRTMALLESGAVTRRPVRILFYGQSIDEQEWTTMLVNRLRERFPGTPIVAENQSLGGWGVPLLVKRFKHDILRRQPDLVEFHAYGGNESEWERVLQNLRRETTADIVIRTTHVLSLDKKYQAANDADAEREAVFLRYLAQKYGAELVDVRPEWAGYLKKNKLKAAALLADGVHLNHKGNVLMAALYERHFRSATGLSAGWADRVRRCEAVRQPAEQKTDEITLAGGWKASGRWVESAAPGDALRLAFTGNRVDVVLGPCGGGARVLIDGRPPSALNLYHGTGPKPRHRYAGTPVTLVRFFEGANLQAETWTLQFLELAADRLSARFRVTGSKTGPDGEGDTREVFTSRSGRITIRPEDWMGGWGGYKVDPAVPLPELRWAVVPDGVDEVRGTPGELKDGLVPYTYITMADGLPSGRHELTLTPVGNAPVCIRAIDVYRPPLSAP